MANPKKISLGVYAAGEIPYPLTHTFKDSKGTVIDLTGFTESVKVEGPDENGSYGTGAVAIDGDPTTGKVSYTWVLDDMTDVGKYTMLLWVTDGSNNLASDLITWEVFDGPGSPGPA
jgi:hypothetical protein